MTTYVDGYHYTITVSEFINDNLGSGNAAVETTDAVDADSYAPVYTWNSSNLDWSSADNGKQVNYKHRLKFEVRVYKDVAPGMGPNPVGILGDDDGVQVVVFQTWLDSIAEYATCKPSFTGSYVRQSQPVSGKGNTVFTFFIDGKGAGPITPKIGVRLKANSQENPLEPEDVNIKLPGTTKMKTVNFTKAKTDPKIPPALKDLVGSDKARWNPCTNEWVGIELINVPGNAPGGFVNVGLVYFDRKGTLLRKKYLGRESITATGPNTYFGQAQEELLAAVRAVCGKVEDPPAEPGESELPTPQDKVRYNPPNHFVTRSVAHGERTTVSEKVRMAGGFVTNVVNAEKALTNRNNRLGKIYQSEDGAAALNKPVKGELKYWGFKFAYNPQTITYGTGTNTSVDWMLNSKDPANLLGGNTEVRVTLYLNRIADMTELKRWNKKDPNYGNNYPRALTKTEIEGLLYRGTEYDLEFLYRVLNGDPGKTALLEYGGKTADFGYITGTPCWFHFHNNMRYYGSMSSINVNHVMFTQEMVPMLSTVDISFIRYPSLELSPDAVKTAFADRAKNVAGTGEEAKS